MAIKKILKFFDNEDGAYVPKDNISTFIKDDVLQKIGRQVNDDYNYDNDSMGEWKQVIQEGKNLCKMTWKSRNDPFTNASNYKSSAMAQAALDFSDRVSYEILKPASLIKIQTSKPMGEENEAPIDRLNQFFNWQLNTQLSEWRDEHEKLMYDLPHTGTVFKKTYYDTTKQRIVSDLITYPNFAVDNDTKSMDKLRRFSETFCLPYNIVEENMRSGQWNRIDIEQGTEDDRIESDQTDFYEFIEQSTWLDLDNDGYDEPYVVVIRKETHDVMRITPRYLLKDVTIEGGIRLIEYISEYSKEDIQDKAIWRIEPIPQLTKYGFIKDVQGGFLDVGYAHLLGGLTQGVNATTNMLMDAGKLSNLPGGWLAKGFRTKMGDQRVEPGEWVETGIDAVQLKNGILPFVFKEPSPTLYQLNVNMNKEIEKLADSADLSETVGANAPATTTLALINEQQQSSSSIMLRLYRSMTCEFNIIAILNGIYLDSEEYSEVVGEQAYFNVDFHTPGVELRPGANPNTSSKIQRIMQVSAELSQIPNIVEAGGNIRPIMEHYLETIDSTVVDQVFPEMTPDQQLQDLLQRNPQLQETISGMQQAASALAEAQTNMLNEESEREDQRLAMDLDNAQVERMEKMAEIEKDKADAALKYASIPEKLAQVKRESALATKDILANRQKEGK